MTKLIRTATLSGLIVGLLIAAMDMVALVLAREMFFTVRELLITAAWTLGICLGAGLVSGYVIAFAHPVLDTLFERLGVRHKLTAPAAIIGIIVAGPAGLWLHALTQGPQASRIPGRLVLIAIGAVVIGGAFGVAHVIAKEKLAPSRGGRRLLLVLTPATIIACHLADAWILVRLYPPFHYALTVFALFLGCAGLYHVVSAVQSRRLFFVAMGLTILTAGFATVSLIEVMGTQNARFVIGHTTCHTADVIALARWVAPPPPERILDEDIPTAEPDTASEPAVKTIARPGADLILVTVDAMRYDRLKLLGARRSVMPHLDALAEQSVVFSRGYTPVPHTSYAITSLLTGKYTKPLYDVPGAPKRHETWPEILHRFRYDTSAFFTPAIFFIDRERFRPYLQTGAGFSYRKADSRLSAEERVDLMIAHLESKETSERPHFAWAHFFEAHEPYEPTCPELGTSPEDRYDCELATVDKALDRLIDYLDKSRPEAIVIVTADHGEEFGDHGGKYHGTTLFDEQVRVPIVMRIPGVAPRVIPHPVSLVDLLGTSLDLLDLPTPARVRSNSLVPLIAGADTAPPVFSEAHDEIMMVKGNLKAVCNTQDDLCMLYDLQADPEERRSIAEQRPEALRAMKRAMVAWRKRHAEIELRPVQAADGVHKWPLAIERALAGEAVLTDLVAVLKKESASRIRQKAAALVYSAGIEGDDGSAQTWRSINWQEEADPVVAGWVASLHAAFGNADAISFLADLAEKLEKDTPVWRVASLTRLAQGDKTAIRDVRAIALMSAAPMDDRRRALKLLAEAGDRRSAKELVSLINTYQIALDVVRTLATLKSRSDFDAIITRLKRERFAERKASIIESLAILGDPRATGPIVTELFGDIPPPGALSALTSFVKPTPRGRTVVSDDRTRRAVLVSVASPRPIAVRLSRVDRVIYDGPDVPEGASVTVTCGDEHHSTPLSSEHGDGSVDFDRCEPNDTGTVEIEIERSAGADTESDAVIAILGSRTK